MGAVQCVQTLNPFFMQIFVSQLIRTKFDFRIRFKIIERNNRVYIHYHWSKNLKVFFQNHKMFNVEKEIFLIFFLQKGKIVLSYNMC